MERERVVARLARIDGPKYDAAGEKAKAEARLGLGRIVALHPRSSTSYQSH